MKESFNNIVIYNGYPLSVVVAVTFHSAILALLLYLQSSKSPEALELIQPMVVKALLVNENPQLANERKRLERQQQQQRTREREAERQKQADAKAEQQRQEQAAADAKAEQQRQEQAAADAKAEQQRKARELASLRQRKEQERLDAEQLSRERQQQKEREEERRQQELDRELDRQRQQEAAAAEVASSEFEMVQSGTSIIQQAVQSVWSRPPSARNGMRAILQIRMLPTGEIVDVSVTESSGDPAFDRSAENAVYSAAPFRELQALPINVFNENFRSLSLIFQPEDLLN